MTCGHLNTFNCFEFTSNNALSCSKDCDLLLYCGHKCKRKCIIDCNHIYDKDAKNGYISPCKE